MKLLHFLSKHSKKIWLNLETISEKCVVFLKDERKFYTLIFLGVTILLFTSTLTCNFSSYPLIFFGSITALFAYQGYKFTKEKFRLDLLDSRKELHEAIRNFGYIINEKHPLIFLSDKDRSGIEPYKVERNDEVLTALKVAHDKIDIPGVFLFYGDDVKNCVMSAKAALTILDLHWEDAERLSMDSADNVEIINTHFKTLNQASIDIPKLLKPYMYFGQYV